MKHSFTLAVFASVLFSMPSLASAKRAAPADVPAVRHGGLEFRAPHKMLGCVEAWDIAKNKRIWFRQIYVIQVDPLLESDVQDVFISNIRLEAKKNTLLVTNEGGGVFSLDLGTLDVTTVMGDAVIKRE